MSSRNRRAARRPAPRQPIWFRRVGPIPVWLGAGAIVAIGVLVAVATVNSLSQAGDPTGGGTSSGPRYDVGNPGPGKPAPDFELASATGQPFRLSDQRGTTVLIYFHEGLGCAPCWQQTGDLQKDLGRFKTVGVDEIITISLDPLAAQQQRAQLRGITLPALADADRSVSTAYDALSYGMMGGATPGHTFILVGADGVIRWRADYGGPPNFTMFVPDETLLAELGKVIPKP